MSASLTAGKLRFVRHRTSYPDPKWYFGLDLGQRRDHSALAALNLQWIAQGRCPVTFEFLFEPQLSIRFLTRFPIGISYERLYDLLNTRLAGFDSVLPVRARQLVIDAGGPGPPIVDRLRRNLYKAVTIRPVIITGGKGANTLAGGYTGVPRRTIVSTIQLLMGSHTLKCKSSLPGWDLLKEELMELSGADTQPGDASTHDDLAIATGLAAWAAAADYPELLPEVEDESRPARRSMDGPGRLF